MNELNYVIKETKDAKSSQCLLRLNWIFKLAEACLLTPEYMCAYA